MRKVFTFCLALGFTFAANAQNWEIGQDITDQLEWRDISGWWEQGGVPKPNGGVNMNPNPSYYWQGTQPNEMAWDANDHNTQGYPAMGFYTDGASTTELVDCYQVIPMVAGKYQIAVNAVYREGTPADTWNNFCEGNIKKNSHLYVQTLATPDGEVIADYDCVIKNLAQSSPDKVTESLFEDSSNTWKNDGSFTTKDADGNEVKLWYPNCDEGASLHFDQGNFLNTLNFIVLEDGYIRFGFRKTANIDQDWLVWSNFRMYWMGEADEQAQIDLALETLDAIFGEATTVSERAEKDGYVALANIINDELIEFSDTYDESDLESINAAIEELNKKVEVYKASYTSAASLGDLVSMSQDMAMATDFPGAAAFESAIASAETVAFAEDPADLDYDAAAYTTAFTNLSEARAAYLDSQDPDPVDGSKDFTMLIKHPWFVKAEYTPKKVYEYDGDEGFWCIQEGDSTTNWHYNAVASGPADVANVYSAEKGRSNVSDGVQLRADGEVANRWFKVICYTDGWSAGLKLMYQGSLVGVSDGWNSMSVGDQELRQRVEGLPAGYYQLRALMRGNDARAGNTSWENQKDPHHNIFARNSDGEEVRSAVGVQDKNRPGWEQWGWNEWNGRVWDEHKTSIIQAPDGKLTIGAMSSMVMNSTGYRLYFMGTTPNFTAMLLEDIEALQPKIEQLSLQGDKAAVEAIVAKVVLPCPDPATYDTYTAYIKEAKDYIDNVTKVMSKWTAADDFVALQSKYDEADPQYAMLQPAVDAALGLEDVETATYKDAQAITAAYNAYNAYFDTFDKCKALGSDELNKIIAVQKDIFAGAYQNAEEVASYEAALAAQYASEYIKVNGGDNATEANPLDVTALIVNPKFDEGAAKGWSGQQPTQNEYARHNTETWNVTSWDTYQIIKGLPAGKYELRVQALYRDAAGGAWETYTANWTGDKATWAQEGYPVLYAQECTPNVDNTPAGDEVTDYITSVADLDGNSTPTFEGYFTDLDADQYPYLADASKFALYEELNADDKENSTDKETGQPVYDKAYDYAGDPVQYPFDARQDIDGGSKFFPESMAGAYLRFREGKYDNTKVNITVVTPGNNLKIGIKKTWGTSGDWVIYTNYRLFFKGFDATAIEAAKVKTAADNKMFNLAGQAVGREYKGIVIKNGQKVLNK